MSSYISSNANRFYAAIETNFGSAASITATQRFPAVKLNAHQALETAARRDKTGARTFMGTPASSRRVTAFELRTYLTSWNGQNEPCYGPLFQAGLGGIPQLSNGLFVSAATTSLQLQTTGPHGLAVGGGVSYGGEIRFVSNVLDTQTVLINAPFAATPAAGAMLSPAITYRVANQLPSASIYDYWDPVTTVSRLIVGAAVDTISFSLNGDFHEFLFSGPAADLLDSCSFVPGQAGLATYPAEPALSNFDYSIVPGHLGEVWLGGAANQFFTLTGANLEVKNNLQLRSHEFGSSYPRAIVAGIRQVVSKIKLLAQDDAQTIALYAAAKQRTPVPAMLQLGQKQGQLMGLFMPQMTPEIPVYDDSQPRLEWQFNNNLAQGVSNDEIYIAFA